MSSLPMAEVSETKDSPVPAPPQAAAGQPTLVCLPSVATEGLYAVVEHLVEALPGAELIIASPDTPPGSQFESHTVRTVAYPPQPTHAGWLLTPTDYFTAATLAREHNARVTLVLGPEASSLSSEGLRALCGAVTDGNADLALPRYSIGPHDGLVTAALLYPISRGLFGVQVRMPLPLDAAFSLRMAARLATVPRKPAAAGGVEPILWPASEASVASLSMHEVPVGTRAIPHPGTDDLNALLAQIAGSLFTDLEAKAAFWQRARSIPLPAVPIAADHGAPASEEDLNEVAAMAESFRSAYTNLHEIWSLVVPPQSLLALKKLSLASAETFAMPPNLWARTVYDFVLAHRLRTINRGHLLGALTPLYLAWVASHIRRADNDATAAEQHIEETAAAFIAERPYILARWRWPDRFNP